VICDGGITRGTHVLKALSVGAKACSGGSPPAGWRDGSERPCRETDASSTRYNRRKSGILRTRDVRTRRRLRDRSLGPQPVGIGIRPHDYPCKTCVSTAMPLCHTPCTRPIERFGDIVAYPILGGLHHRYARI
jgi:hypothetical protein